MTNPWMNMWIDAANNYAQGVQNFWLREMQRHQAALMQEGARQSSKSWLNAWTVLPFDLMKRSFR